MNEEQEQVWDRLKFGLSTGVQEISCADINNFSEGDDITFGTPAQTGIITKIEGAVITFGTT